MIKEITRQLDDLIVTAERSKTLAPEIAAAGDELVRALSAGRKVLTAGNGGSAADALHLAEELMGRFIQDRRSLPAVCLCADPTLLTCIGNDYGFDRLFSRQIEGLGGQGDVLVVFSSSGNSANLVEALKSARHRGLKSIALLGKSGGRCRGLADHEVIVPSDTTARVQEIQTLVLHCWLTAVEAALVDR